MKGVTATGWTTEDMAARRRLRLLVGVFTGLLWIDNLTEHYRGAFAHKLMWAPVLLNPIVAVAGVAAALSPRAAWRRGFLGLAAAQMALGMVGFGFHQRGIARRVGSGWRMYVFHAWYGPPIFAPLQYVGFGALGLLAALPERSLTPLVRLLSWPRLLRLYVAVSAPPLWGEIAYLHWRGSFQDPFQWLPVVSIPAVGAAGAVAAASDSETARRVYVGSIRWLTILGIAGTIFHLVGLGRRYDGYTTKAFLFNWLSGPPVPAPSQLIGLGLVALTGERAGRQR